MGYIHEGQVVEHPTDIKPEPQQRLHLVLVPANFANSKGKHILKNHTFPPKQESEGHSIRDFKSNLAMIFYRLERLQVYEQAATKKWSKTTTDSPRIFNRSLLSLALK